MSIARFGTAFGPKDLRTAEERAADLRSTQALVRKMLDVDEEDDSLHQRVLAHLRTRRAARLDEFVAFDLLDGGRDSVVVTPGRIVMRRSTYEDSSFQAFLADRGLNDPTPRFVAGLDDRLVALDLPAEHADAVRGFAGTGAAPVERSYVAEAMGVVKKSTPPVTSAGGYSAAPDEVLETDRTVHVEIIDTGITDVARTDGWLAAIPVHADNVDGLDLLPEPNEKLDFAAGHGTFVAGIVQQVAPRAKVTVRRAIDTDGMASTIDLAVAMVEAARTADVLSLSFGLETEDDREPLPFQVALEIIEEMRRSDNRQIVVVAAAGNYGGPHHEAPLHEGHDHHDHHGKPGHGGRPVRHRPSWPGASASVLAVGGLTQTLTPALWSTRGDWVDCSTIAEGVRSTFVPGTPDSEPEFRDNDQPTFGRDAWVLWVGTSFAAPQVAGAIAHLAGEYRIGVEAARDLLLAGCESIPGYGRKLCILPPI